MSKKTITSSRVTTFLKGLFDRESELVMDDALKSRIARSLLGYIRKNPSQGVAAIGELIDQIKELQQENRALRASAMVDHRTGAYNLRFFERVMSEINSNGLPLKRQPTARHFILMIDLDGFKRINDTYGHDCGDAALRHVVKELQVLTRKSDIICRIGGDEFVLILKNATEEGARKKIIELDDAFQKMSFGYNGATVPVRASFGWSEVHPSAFVHDIMKKIDEDLYAAKNIKGEKRHSLPESGALESLQSTMNLK